MELPIFLFALHGLSSSHLRLVSPCPDRDRKKLMHTQVRLGESFDSHLHTHYSESRLPNPLSSLPRNAQQPSSQRAGISNQPISISSAAHKITTGEMASSTPSRYSQIGTRLGWNGNSTQQLQRLLPKTMPAPAFSILQHAPAISLNSRLRPCASARSPESTG